MNSLPPMQTANDNPNTSISNSNNVHNVNNHNHFHFKKNKFNKCIVKVNICCNSSLKRIIAVVLIILSFILLTVNAIAIIRTRNALVNAVCIFAVELAVVVSSVCMAMWQVVVTKERKNKVMLGIGSCVLLLGVVVEGNVVRRRKRSEMQGLVVNCVLCLVMLGLDGVLLMVVNKEMKVEMQKQQHIEEIINFTETGGDKGKQQERNFEIVRIEE